MKIVLIEPLGVSKEYVEKLSSFIKERGHEFVAYDDRQTEASILIERAKDADVVMITNLPFKAEVIEKCPNLKMISVAFTGVDHVDMDACKKQNIVVCNSAGYSTNAVAELAFGFMIGLYRRMLACDDVTRKEGTKAGLIGFELCGKKLGIVGTGAIGSKVIEIGLAVGCEVLAYSRTKRSELIDKGVKYVELDELLKNSDIVSLHCPLNAETKGLIGKEQINMMKQSAILINTARGPVLDSNALADALNEGKIAGAGIDVFETEPPIDKNHPLLNAENTTVAPHVAFATKESLEKRAVIVFENIKKWLDNNPQNVM